MSAEGHSHALAVGPGTRSRLVIALSIASVT